VDDNLDVAEVFIEILKQGGFHPLVAFSGEECLDILKTETPDLILLDIMMEPMDGWETLEQIKAGLTTALIPVIMLTSKQVTPAEIEKYGKYIEDYVMKPVTNYELCYVIEHVLDRQRNIEFDVTRAMQRDVDFGVVDEYAQLARSIDINERFLNLFETRNDLNNPTINTNNAYGQAVSQLDTTIRFQKIRLQQIKEQIKVMP